jgi:hypothetical protein
MEALLELAKQGVETSNAGTLVIFRAEGSGMQAKREDTPAFAHVPKKLVVLQVLNSRACTKNALAA